MLTIHPRRLRAAAIKLRKNCHPHRLDAAAIKLRKNCHPRAGGDPFPLWHIARIGDGFPPARE